MLFLRYNRLQRRRNSMDFQTVYNRKNTHSFKWDNLQAIFKTDDILPMWVADMDFKAPKEVNDAIINHAKHGIYGYTIIDDSIKGLVIDWVKKRHHWDIQTDWLSFSPGVITSLHIAIQTFTKPGDSILIQTPVYTPFFNIIKNGDRHVVQNSLLYKDNRYEIDFVDFEEKLKQVQAFILCSPHNPVGRVWTKEELEKMARLCLKHNVLILADEIHADLIFSGQQHIPVASLSDEVAERTITCMSPTKTFNLAGLQVSYVITKNDDMRKLINQALRQQGFSMLNTMGIIALEAAYQHGEKWLEELMNVIQANKEYTKTTLENTKKLKVIDSEGTYLIWVDCSQLNMDSSELQQFMIQEAKVGLNPGISYGKEGAKFMRINIACPQKTLTEGIERIVTAVNRL